MCLLHSVCLSVCLPVWVNQENDSCWMLKLSPKMGGGVVLGSLNELWLFLFLVSWPSSWQTWLILYMVHHAAHLCLLVLFFWRRCDDETAAAEQRRKPFTCEFHSWIKGRIEMESIIIIISLSLSLSVSGDYDADDTVPPRGHLPLFLSLMSFVSCWNAARACDALPWCHWTRLLSLSATASVENGI